MESAYSGFVGRSTELTALAECAVQCAAGVPWLVVVEGEAGIGKTALVRQALTAMQEFEQWWAGCDAGEKDYRFGVVGQLLHRVPRAELQDYSMLQRVVDAASAPEVGSQVLRLLGTLEERRPIVLVVDDIQWIDEESMAVLRFLVRRWWTERILIVVTNRTAPAGTALAREQAAGVTGPKRLLKGVEHATVLSLDGLGREEVEALARTKGTAELSAQAAERLISFTGGHPLYLQSLFSQASPRALADPRSSLPVPGSLAAVVRQILAGLGEDSRSLVEALAVLNAQVPLGVAAQVAQIPDAAAALGPALALGLLEWWPDIPSTPVRLRHALQRDAVYEAILPTRRRQLHRAAAPMVDVGASWAHRVAAADHADAALADELQAEAQRQAAVGRAARAATLLLWSADLSEQLPVREGRILTAVTQLLQASDYERGFALESAIEQCAPSAARSSVLGRLAFGRGAYAMAEDLLTTAVAQAGRAGDTKTAALALAWLGGVHVWQNRGADALPPLCQALEIGPPDPQFVGYAEYLWVLASEWVDGAGDTFRGFEARHPNLPADSEAVPLEDSSLLRARSIARGAMGYLRGATEDLVTLTGRQRDGHVADVRATDYFMLASHQYWSGQWEEALISAERALGLAATNGPLSGQAPGQAVAAMVAAGQGRWQAAERHCRASAEAARDSAVFADIVYPAFATAVLAQARGEREGMFRALQPIHDGPQVGSVFSWRLIWMPLFAEGQISVGDVEEAAHTLVRIKELDVPSLRVGIRWLEGLVAEGRRDLEAAESCYREGIALPAARDDMPLHRAFIEHAYGRLLAESGRRDVATEHLRAARSRYDALGAVPFSQRLDDMLAAGGSSSTRQGSRGALAELTDRERAVAHLAAQGLTNQEIAKELYVSAKTVEYHLGHVYTKLDLRSRRQLRTVMAPAG
ncbi:ATP-binding protein [Streptacidiphilus rugosus]|uniref:ATP-binding protein n=1 Tax=Streptacidiphilus rugosus TaxID=405783 RepID=UPI000563A792|nr:LuxR family transcriptional regulator [Streptacidiphilus rugosus]